MNKRNLLINLAAVTAAALTSASASAQTPIEIGATVPLTGPAALSGTQYHNSLRLAEEQINKTGGINGKPIRFLFEDAQSSNPTALNAFVKIVQEKKPAFVFLSSYSTQNLAVAPEVLKAKVPVMYAGGADAIHALRNPYMFRIRPADSTAAQAMAQFVKNGLKATKPGIIYIQNDFGQGAARAATKLLADAGITVVASEAYGINDKDMSAQLLNLKNKGADAIIALSFPQDGALLLRQIKTMGLKQPVVASSGTFLPAAMQLMSPSDLENVWGVIDALLETNPHAANFLKEYKARFRTDADAYAAVYFDGAMMLADAMRKVGPDPEKLREHLAGIRNYQGVAGVFSFDASGNGVHEVTIVNFRKGTKDMVFVSRVAGQ